MNLKILTGSGDKIGTMFLPFIVGAGVLIFVYPQLFTLVFPVWLRAVALFLLAGGLIVWAWSVALILIYVPKDRLITSGPFALVKHPLYTGVSLLVIPSLGMLIHSWLGIPLGIILYLISRKYAPLEEKRA